MAIKVNITAGFHRGNKISGIFRLIKPYQDSATGGFLTIEAPKDCTWAMTNSPRIKLGKDDFTLLDVDGNELDKSVTIEAAASGSGIEAVTNYGEVFARSETDEEAIVRISDTFSMLDKIVDACANDIVRGLVVSGPPGIGKSFGVEKQLDAANMCRTACGKDPLYEIVSGGVSAIGLFQKLYHNRSTHNVLVFDDCDGILFEEESLSLLKAALNSGDKRRICWNKESRTLAAEDIPDAFDFEASIIFLSNIDFERSIAKGSRISAHLEAIMSRCHYLDLEIGSLRDRLLRIKQVMQCGMLAAYEFTPAQEADILKFVYDNAEYLREISLRMVKKIADFVKADPDGWMEMAEATCLYKEARFKRLLAKRLEAERREVVMNL